MPSVVSALLDNVYELCLRRFHGIVPDRPLKPLNAWLQTLQLVRLVAGVPAWACGLQDKFRCGSCWLNSSVNSSQVQYINK